MPQLQNTSHTCIVMCMEWFLKKFFFQRNILIGSFLFFLKKIFLSHFFFSNSTLFPFCFTLWIIFQFIFLLALYFEFFSNLSSLYIYFYIKGTIIEKHDLKFFREFFQSLKVLQPNLMNPPWILLENSFNFFFGSPTQF